MECRVFRKKINDLLEDNISNDMKDVMLKHIESCKECKALYDEEILIDKEFRMALKVEPQSFRSLRGDIMKNIDKNKYGKNPMKRFLLHFKKFRTTYSAAAAIIFLAVVITPYAVKNGFSFRAAKKAESQSGQNAVMDSKALSIESAQDGERQLRENVALKQSKEDENSSTLSASEVTTEAVYIPKFQKKEIDKSFKPNFNTSWQFSPNRIYSATVEGRGEGAYEEGIANIIVKNLKTNEQWSFDMTENEEKKYTPKAVKWVTDETLLVIVGYGYGTISPGGKLYLLNIGTADTIIADPLNTAKLDESKNSQVTKILDIRYSKDKPLEIDAEVTIYDDKEFISSHTEKRTITSYIPPFN